MAAMVRLLHDARFVGREAARPHTRTYVLHFRKGDQDMRVCWATLPGKVQVDAEGGLSRIDLMGNASPVETGKGPATLDVGETPFYLLGKVRGVSEVAAGPAVVADLSADFSKTQGATNWYYGYFDGAGGGAGDGIAPSGLYTDDDFKPFTWERNEWGERWAGPLPYLGADRGGLHPQVQEGKAVWAVQRWKSPLRGRVQVKGRFERDRQGDGCTVLVLVGGRRIFEQHVGGPKSPTRRDFTLDVDVAEGTLVDFAVTPGPANHLDNDATRVDARITVAR